MAFQTNFKEPRSGKIERFKRRQKRKTHEDAEKAKVRRRDKGCRFPLCECRKMNLALHASHRVHKGMGGSPKGEVDDEKNMIRLCVWRHQQGRIAVHRGTLKWDPLTEDGANGPVEWFIDPEALGLSLASVRIDGMVSIAIETSRGVIKPPDPWERAILLQLAQMNS